MDKIQKEYHDKAVELCAIMSQFHPCEVIKGEDRTDYHVKMTVADTDFKVSKDYNGNIQIQLYKYECYNHVSSSTCGEVYKKHVTNNMKVPTLKKVVAKVNACIAERDEFRRLEKAHIEKQRMFLCDIKALNLPVEYNYNYIINDEHKRENTDIKGGTIIKNGVQFQFTFKQDGYISQRVTLHYSVNNDIKDFIALSDNAYKPQNHD